MNKKIILVCSVLFSIIMLIGCSSSKENRENEILEYLSNKYNQRFSVVSVVDESDIDEDRVFEYNISPVNYPEIIFSAGQEKSDSNILPFAPPIKEKVFFDDYFEKSKEYIVGKNKREFVINDFNEIEARSSQIFEMMSNINDELSKYGFSVTKYTPSVSLEIMMNGKLEKINFYIMEESIISDLIVNAYEK